MSSNITVSHEELRAALLRSHRLGRRRQARETRRRWRAVAVDALRAAGILIPLAIVAGTVARVIAGGVS